MTAISSKCAFLLIRLERRLIFPRKKNLLPLIFFLSLGVHTVIFWGVPVFRLKPKIISRVTIVSSMKTSIEKRVEKSAKILARHPSNVTGRGKSKKKPKKKLNYRSLFPSSVSVDIDKHSGETDADTKIDSSNNHNTVSFGQESKNYSKLRAFAVCWRYHKRPVFVCPAVAYCTWYLRIWLLDQYV